MARVQLQNKEVYVVEFVEYERGWGSKTLDIEHYDNKEEAIKRVMHYNKIHNSESSVPDWYIAAEYVGRKII